MTLQEFAKATPDFWKWIAEGRKFRFRTKDGREKGIISKMKGITINGGDVYFLSEKFSHLFENAEPIQTIKKPVSFWEAIKWFEDPANWEVFENGYRKVGLREAGDYFSYTRIRAICEGREPLHDWFPCVEVDQEAEG